MLSNVDSGPLHQTCVYRCIGNRELRQSLLRQRTVSNAIATPLCFSIGKIHADSRNLECRPQDAPIIYRSQSKLWLSICVRFAKHEGMEGIAHGMASVLSFPTGPVGHSPRKRPSQRLRLRQPARCGRAGWVMYLAGKTQQKKNM